MAKRKTHHFLSLRQFAAHVGAKDPTMSGYKLPEPDAVVGPVNDDGTYPRGTVRGWLESTVDEWQASRPGQGARTDLEGTRMTSTHDNRLRMTCNRMKLRRYRTTDVTEGRYGREFKVYEDPHGKPVDLTVTDLGPRNDGTPSDIRWGAEAGETDTRPGSTPDELADRLVETIEKRRNI